MVISATEELIVGSSYSELLGSLGRKGRQSETKNSLQVYGSGRTRSSWWESNWGQDSVAEFHRWVLLIQQRDRGSRSGGS